MHGKSMECRYRRQGVYFQEKVGSLKADLLLRTELLGSMGLNGEKRAFGKLWGSLLGSEGSPLFGETSRHI